MKRLLVCGGRDFRDRALVETHLDALSPDFDILVVGYDPDDPKWQGADQIAAEWAWNRGKELELFPANWSLHGNAGGPIRNSEMVKTKPYIVLAFPRKNGKWGPGTSDTIRKAKAKSIPVRAIMV